ncbi:MAG: NF038122 family metalloprotease [Rhodospirillales bacterium]|nr:NF038122 family metalloprotease [Rhodospirillales bacterium]MDE2576713.1 NF038122 family metalloprotease [Rhodospirillales bacterium]
MSRLPLLLAIGAIGLACPAHALTITFDPIAGDSLTGAESQAFGAAAAAWESVLTDPVTVSIAIGFRDLGSNILGQTSIAEVTAPYGSVAARLALDATSAADATAVAHLPAAVPGGSIAMTSADARAIGFATPAGAIDAQIEFTSNPALPFQTSRNAGGGISAGMFDLIGVAEHEIGHALGFVSNVGSDAAYTPLDLFRYQSPTPAAGLSHQIGEAASFSIDGGQTSLATFADGNFYQPSHWSGSVPALMDPALASGTVQTITPLDVTALDVIGWDTSVPEPAAAALLAPGLAVLALTRRRRRA